MFPYSQRALLTWCYTYLIFVHRWCHGLSYKDYRVFSLTELLKTIQGEGGMIWENGNSNMYTVM